MTEFVETYQPILYTILGALIALESGFIHHRYQSKIQRREEDRRLLLEINTILLDYHALLSSHESNNLEKVTLLDRLSKAALQVRDDKLLKLTLKLTNFSLDKTSRNEKTLFMLTNEVQRRINPKLVEGYKSIDYNSEI